MGSKQRNETMWQKYTPKHFLNCLDCVLCFFRYKNLPKIKKEGVKKEEQMQQGNSFCGRVQKKEANTRHITSRRHRQT